MAAVMVVRPRALRCASGHVSVGLPGDPCVEVVDLPPDDSLRARLCGRALGVPPHAFVYDPARSTDVPAALQDACGHVVSDANGVRWPCGQTRAWHERGRR